MGSILNVIVGGVFVSVILVILFGIGKLMGKLFKDKIEYSFGGICLGVFYGMMTVAFTWVGVALIIALIHDLNWLGEELMS